uniref:Large ribosomal subunit protein eL14 n=1 Tax=Suberites domuncula TaxID=55567 RepID=Q4KTH1_SUBDO|nr:L14 [Suberites domuncula]
MVFKRFVEVGRVALINDGLNRGKLCVILDVVDQRRALVDGPGLKRQAISFSKLSLTDFTVKISRSAREKQVKAAFENADIATKWEQTSWAKRIARKDKRTKLTDFDRFKLRVLRQQKSRIVRGQYYKIKKEAAAAK